MPQFTLHRNHVLRSLQGRSVEFKKGVSTHVPPQCVQEAIAIGAVPADGMDAVDPPEDAKVVLTPDERKQAIFAAFATMAARGERSDFTASGIPNAKHLFPLTGFEVTSAERDTCWTEYRAGQQADKDQSELDARLDD